MLPRKGSVGEQLASAGRKGKRKKKHKRNKSPRKYAEKPGPDDADSFNQGIFH
jgi:hypothetical protein